MSPFFCFQDIITSAMAVLIVIIMLLALYMGGTGSPSSADPAARELTTRLKLLLDELTQIKNELRVAGEVSAAQLDPLLLKGQVQALRNELEALVGQARSNKKRAESVREKDGAAVVRSELAKEQKRIADAAIRLEHLEKDSVKSRDEMLRAEEAAKAKEAQLLEEGAKRNQLWLIPDRSASSKEPVLAVVSANQLTLQRFDQSEKETLNGSGVLHAFEAALKKYSPLNHYVVFYFKPSGAAQFNRLTGSARSAGFEIGYDTIGEDIVINFNPAK